MRKRKCQRLAKVRNNTKNRIERLGYDLYFSLERSGVRRDILLYLKIYPSGVPIFDISQIIAASYTNTKGAILVTAKGTCLIFS